MTFIHDDFLLTSEPAKRLYHNFAADQPILDYHSHLSPEDIANNRQFANLTEMWLEGDHYKWRAMRCDGIGEEFVTGDAPPKEKFRAWASVVPHTLRNPLYHWTHLELKRYFDINLLLNPDTADEIWDIAQEKISSPEMTTQGILKKFDVRAACTTDDPADGLDHHQAIADAKLPNRVYPTFRPDNAVKVDDPVGFNTWADKLSDVSGIEVNSLATLEQALRKRHDDFHAIGGRLSDHGFSQCYAEECDEATAAAVFDKARAGTAATQEEKAKFASYLMLLFGRMDAEKSWTKQMHVGVRRNNNSRFYKNIGPDTGFDSIDDPNHAESLCRYLDNLDKDNSLPKMVVYNLNPSDNYLFATMLANFQDGSVAGKIQFGSGWWFLDQKEAMEWQMNALSNNGLLYHFVGMLTDSRSFLSFPRHEYFRRTLCNLIGKDLDQGLLPNDMNMVGDMVRRICYSNARDFLGLEVEDGALS